MRLHPLSTLNTKVWFSRTVKYLIPAVLWQMDRSSFRHVRHKFLLKVLDFIYMLFLSAHFSWAVSCLNITWAEYSNLCCSTRTAANWLCWTCNLTMFPHFSSVLVGCFCVLMDVDIINNNELSFLIWFFYYFCIAESPYCEGATISWPANNLSCFCGNLCGDQRWPITRCAAIYIHSRYMYVKQETGEGTDSFTC